MNTLLKKGIASAVPGLAIYGAQKRLLDDRKRGNYPTWKFALVTGLAAIAVVFGEAFLERKLGLIDKD